jgi:hypothetical protein
MALYVPAGRRRRNIVIGLVAAVVVGLVVGVVLGRVTAPTVDDRVASVHDGARAVVGALAATPNEYRKQLEGAAEFRRGGGVDQALAIARGDLQATLGDAPWLGPAARREALAALDAVVAAERGRHSAARYEAVVQAASDRIAEILGIAPS